MSTVLLGETWPLDMPPSAKFVAISLADQANDTGVCWPSVGSIAVRTGFVDRTIQDCLQWLESNGYMRREFRYGRSTVYHLTPAAYSPPQQVHLPPQEMHPTPAVRSPTPAAGSPITINEPSMNHHGTNKGRAVALPLWLPGELWQDFKDHRKAIKAPLTPQAERLLLAKLEKFRARGIDPLACLTESIENGWRGVFAPKASQAKKSVAEQIADAYAQKEAQDGKPV